MKRITALVLALLAVGSVFAAPAPLPNKKSSLPPCAASMIGKWEVKWGGATQTAVFRGDGTYEGSYATVKGYVGTWGFSDGNLIINETTTPMIGNHTVFTIRLDKTSTRRCISGDVTWKISGCRNSGKTTVLLRKIE